VVWKKLYRITRFTCMGVLFAEMRARGKRKEIISFSNQPKIKLGFGLIFLLKKNYSGMIIFAGWGVFHNIDAVLFGFLFTVVETLVIDKLMYGFNSGKITMVISKHHLEIASGIQEEIDRSSTRLMAKGSYTGEETEVLLCACRRSEQARLNILIRKIDPDAFVIILDYSDVFRCESIDYDIDRNEIQKS